MSNIIMNPMLQNTVPGTGSAHRNQVDANRERSFSDHMEQRIRESRNEKKNLLGVQADEKKIKEDIKKKDENGSLSVEGILQQLMNDLEKMVKEPNTEVGKWSFALEGTGLLEKLADQAGMDFAELSLLKQQMREDGSLPLADLFASLEKHFAELGNEKSIVAPETDLPLLGVLLGRMGVSAEEQAKLNDKGVNGSGQLDLAAFLQGLQEVSGDALNAITLSDYELEQFQGMLKSAGVSAEQQMEMFSEKMLMWQRAMAGMKIEEGEGKVELTLDRLKSILDQSVTEIDLAREKANMAGFLTELHKVLSESGYQGKEAAWNPVVQESLTEIYQELQKMIDMAKVKVETKTELATIDEELKTQWQDSGKQSLSKDVSSLELAKQIKADVSLQESTGQSEDSDSSLKNGQGQSEAGGGQQPESGQSFADHNNSGKNGTQVAVGNTISSDPGGEQVDKSFAERMNTPRLKLSPEMQQFTMDQISQGVARGLKNNQHSLTLTMYPKELGEVKVDLQVRDNQLAVSFVMENSKVKGLLEANMEEFKENLEKHGFNLEECSVSVDHDELDDSRRQRFELAWEQIIANQSAEKNTVLPEDFVMISGESQERLRQGGISMFV